MHDIRKIQQLMENAIQEGDVVNFPDGTPHEQIDSGVQEIADRLEGIDPSDTWGVIDAIGWGRVTTDYKRIEEALTMVFDRHELEQIEMEARKFKNMVYARAEDIEKEDDIDNFFGFSDDGWDDATAHIVGLGKKVFDMFMTNPRGTKEQLESNGGPYWNKENFFYSFP